MLCAPAHVGVPVDRKARCGHPPFPEPISENGAWSGAVWPPTPVMPSGVVGELIAPASAWNRASVVTVAMGCALHARLVEAQAWSQDWPAAPQRQCGWSGAAALGDGAGVGAHVPAAF